LNYVQACKKFGSPLFCRTEPEVSAEFRIALEFLEWDITPQQVIAFSRLAALVSAIALIPAAVFNIIFAPLVLIIPFALLHVITEHPKYAAGQKAAEALSTIPRTFNHLVISLKQSPNLEQGIRFAAENGEGWLADSFRRIYWKVWTGKTRNAKHGLISLGEKSKNFMPEFERAVTLVNSAVSEKDRQKRNSSLDHSLEVLLSGAKNRVRSYVGSLFLPTLILFSLGSILPLIFISLLPVTSFFGMSMGSPREIIIILSATLVVIGAYSQKILSSRPPSFTVRTPESELPAWKTIVHGKKVNIILLFAALFLLTSGIGIFYLLSEAGLIVFKTGLPLFDEFGTMFAVAGAAASISITAWAWYKPRIKESKEINELEEQALDAAYHLSARLSDGKPLEESVGFVATSMPGTKTAELFKTVWNNIRRRAISIEQAFTDPRTGVLNKTKSSTLRTLFRLALSGSKKGTREAADALMTFARQLEDLRDAEKTMKEMIQKNISMLKATVAFFGPVVAGIVVTLHEIVQSAIISAKHAMTSVNTQYNLFSGLSGIGEKMVSVQAMQAIIGIYILLLSVVLIRYVTLIEQGEDKTAFAYNLARYMPVVAVVFMLTRMVSKMVIGG